MRSVAARILGQARFDGSFAAKDTELSGLLDSIRSDLAEGEHLMMSDESWALAPREDYKVLVGKVGRDFISLSCHFGLHSLFGRLRIDGIIDQRGSGLAVSLEDLEQRVEPELEDERRMQAALKSGENLDRDQPQQFEGIEFLRALSFDPQPDAAVQIFAAELYGDGLVVCFGYDNPVEGREQKGTLRPNVSISDDLDTIYVGVGEVEGGVRTVRGRKTFVPGIHPGAKWLDISTCAGVVTVEL
jgi:hypothetical protein